MTYSQKALLKQLLLVVLLLAAILLSITLYRHHRAAQTEEPADTPEQSDSASAVQEGYSQLTYSNGSATLSFSRDEDGVWVWSDDPSFPLDDSTVVRILNLLTGLKPQQTITDGDTLEAYGLETPSATLTATDSSTDTVTTLSFGKATTDGTSRYLLMNDDQSTVYIVADTLFQELSIPIFEMCRLPEFPAWTSQNLTEITVSGAVDTDLTAIHPEGSDSGEADADAAVSWRAEGANVTDSETVLNLLGELKDLSFSKCIDYRPAEEATALCGLDTPTLTLTVVYQSAGQEETLTLTVGGLTMDQTGYYTRLDDDSTIYQLDTDAISTLLQVASSGLSD